MYSKETDYHLRHTDTKKINAQEEAMIMCQVSEEERIWSLNFNQVSITKCKEIPDGGIC